MYYYYYYIDMGEGTSGTEIIPILPTRNQFINERLRQINYGEYSNIVQ